MGKLSFTYYCSFSISTNTVTLQVLQLQFHSPKPDGSLTLAHTNICHFMVAFIITYSIQKHSCRAASDTQWISVMWFDN